MIQNYLTIFIRVLNRQKFYSFINVFGLSIGITSAILIGLYLANEWGYDRFHKDADITYRFGFAGSQNGIESSFCLSGSGAAEILKEEIPEIESTLRLAMWRNKLFQYQEKSFNEKNVLRADTNFFNFFSFELLEGNPKTVLQGANKIIISESLAKKYFNYGQPEYAGSLGKTMDVGGVPMEVSGVIIDPPSNSHFHYSSIVNLNIPDSVIHRTVYTYFKTRNIRAAREKFSRVYDRLFSDEDKKLWSSDGNYFRYFAQPLVDIHLNSYHSGEFEANGSINQLYLLGLIAVFVILLACINFINLATARAAKRAKEIGIRKISGAIRSKIVQQFLIESLLYSGLSILLSLAFTSVTLNIFNTLIGTSLDINSLAHPVSISALLLLWTIIAVLSGGYPSIYLSSVKPTNILKGKLNISSRGTSIRNYLVAFQFTISISLIIATATVYQQIRFMQTHNLGYDKENILFLSNIESLESNKVVFKNELNKLTGVISSSYSECLPTEIESQYIFNVKGSDINHTLRTYGTDADQIQTVGFKLKRGRFFSNDISTDSSAVVINEVAAKLMGINLSEKIYLEDGESQYEVIGIIQDFNYASLRSEIMPLVLYFGGSKKMMIRLESGDVQNKIDLISKTWRKFSPAPFEFGFLDESVNQLYLTERKFGKIAMVFSCIAVSIACVGLLGLVAYLAGLRSKEIGIRKVLGANVVQINILIIREFIGMLIIALFIAIPVTWIGITKWLEHFAYRINFDIVVAVSSGLLIIAISLLTISYQSIQAAKADPVKSLKTE